jgi:hypothetical protein
MVLPWPTHELHADRHSGVIGARRHDQGGRAGQAGGKREDEVVAGDRPIQRRSLHGRRGQRQIDLSGGLEITAAEAIPVPELASDLRT